MPNPLYDALIAPHVESDAIFLDVPEAVALSYRVFIALAAQYAHVVCALGLNPGDRLAAQVPKSPEALALYVACVQSGVVFLPLNTAYTASEIGYFLEDSSAQAFICDPAKQEPYAPLAAEHGATLLTLGASGDGSLPAHASEMADQFPTADRAADDLAALLYTSGTTGRSKGAMLTHENLLSNAQALAEAWAFSEHDRLIHALPIFHTHGLFVATNIVLLTGGTMIFLPKFDGDAILDALPNATTMMGVPTFYTRLLADPHLTPERAASMRLFISGSAPLLEETHREFEARTGHRILERYGMTETNMNTTNPYDGERRAGTVGFALPGVDLKITQAESGEALAQGEIGQIEVRGPNVFRGYWNMPEKTAEELRDDGFFITGDLGRIDDEGYLHIVGRNKDLIISGGYNIYPKEIELVLDTHETVVESAVIGIPDADFGEAVLAVIVARTDTLDIEELRHACQALARFKQPKHFAFVDDLPRNTMGKVQKNVLRERYKSGPDVR
ncbi:MAG: malonyl-CoA synthase [Pseudomonadota bacterium]